MKPRVLGIILAGGQGSRLAPLTSLRSKPSVPFGGKYRIIDFAINNLINSGIFSVYVLTQYKAQSLTEHISRGWRFGSFLPDYFVTVVPAQMTLYEELGSAWYRGTADSVYQNLNLVEDFDADYIAILSGDHIYKMNLEHMLEQHIAARADVSIAAFPMSRSEAHRFGVMQVDGENRVTEFLEKPSDPPGTPDDPEVSLTSMGNYIFSRRALMELLDYSINADDQGFDFGQDVIPYALRSDYHVHAYDFHQNTIPGQDLPNSYWRDVGTIDAYFEANMDLISVNPEYGLYNSKWPLRTTSEFSPPVKFVHESEGRKGQAFNTIMAGGVIVSGGTVRDSVLGRDVRINSYSLVEQCVLFDSVNVGRGCQLRQVIVDKDVEIPPNTKIGYNHEHDRARGLTVSEGGVVVVPKGFIFQRN
ncbi:glucose-1-phosphate adenylyltransferase [Deinococcus radiophilus]|nr:glucose-1-phosphate adenylyltransferase [Deinococcus radiophilus]UFA50856.1 glucose-1-phosphate adenylyltransferase [Deinococcus radiophilus]